MSEKKAKFFCENCGAEVPAKASMCRHCGRFFSSVRCPQCGKTGTNNTFKNGCPRCGYAEPKSKKHIDTISIIAQKEQKAARRARKRLAGVIDSSPLAPAKSTDALPGWMFALSFLALLFFIVLLNLYIRK